MAISSKRTENWPSAIVFDLDGTLVDSSGDIAAALNELLSINRLPPFSVEEVIDFIGDGVSALVKRAFVARGWSPNADELSAHLVMFRAIYGERLTRLTRAYDGCLDLLSSLKGRGIDLGICTNKEENLARGVIDGLGLRECFRAVVGGTPGRPAKPSPAPLLETIARLGVCPEEAIMVGDSAADLFCARNSDVAFIGVTFGYSRPPMSELGAEITIGNYSEFEAACCSLWERRP